MMDMFRRTFRVAWPAWLVCLAFAPVAWLLETPGGFVGVVLCLVILTPIVDRRLRRDWGEDPKNWPHAWESGAWLGPSKR